MKPILLIIFCVINNISAFEISSKIRIRKTNSLVKLQASVAAEGPDPNKDILKSIVVIGCVAFYIGWQSSQFGSIHTSFDNLKTSFGTLETTVDNLKTSFGTLETTVDNLKTSFGTLETTVDKLETTVDNLKTSVGTLEIMSMTQEKSLSNLQFKFDGVAIAFGSFIAVIAASGNIVKVLEYIDKKAKEEKLSKGKEGKNDEA